MVGCWLAEIRQHGAHGLKRRAVHISRKAVALLRPPIEEFLAKLALRWT